MKKVILVCSLISICTLTIFSQIPTDGLVGFWSFTGNANDESGNENHGTVHGATLTEDRFGNMNSAYSFDGVDDHILVNSTIGNFEESDFTISIWLKITELPLPGHGQYMGKRSAGTHGNYWNTGVTTTGECNFEIDEITGDDRNVLRGTINLNNDIWNHIVIKRNGDKYVQYFNGVVDDSLTGHTIHNINNDVTLTFGARHFNSNLYGFHKGEIDDIRIYYRALDEDEIFRLQYENICTDTSVNDTTTYYVSSNEFIDHSPRTLFDSTLTLIRSEGICDSVVNYYSEFLYEPNHCSDTTYITDTTFITVTDSISVTDTLIIDAVLTSVDPPDNTNTLRIYPNPARDHIFINTGDYTKMDGYSLKIIDQLGAVVFETNVEEALYEVNLSTWTGMGLYFVQVIDSGGMIIDTRKIVLQ